MRSSDYADLGARVRAAPPRCGPVRVVAVDGPSGSGKTSFAGRLAAALDDAPVVHMDDLYPGWDGLADGVSVLVAQVLRPLAAAGTATYRRWDWYRSTWGEPVDVPVTPFLVVEGCGCGSRAAAPFLTLLVWLDAPVDVRRDRGLARDGGAFAPFWDRWTAQEHVLFAVERTRQRADVHVDTSDGDTAAGDTAEW